MHTNGSVLWLFHIDTSSRATHRAKAKRPIKTEYDNTHLPFRYGLLLFDFLVMDYNCKCRSQSGMRPERVEKAIYHFYVFFLLTMNNYVRYDIQHVLLSGCSHITLNVQNILLCTNKYIKNSKANFTI